MSDIVYYRVPQLYMSGFYDVDNENWVGIIVTDSEHIYENKKFLDRFRQVLLADDFAKVAHVLWIIKEKSEQLIFRKKSLSGCSDETVIVNENDIFEKLESTNDRKSEYMLEYIYSGTVNKFVCSHYYENINIYVRIDKLHDTEKLLEKIAEKGKYYKYELDEVK